MTAPRAAQATERLTAWEFRSDRSDTAQSVRLPHDAMLGAERGPSSTGGADTAWFAGGRYEYRTMWTAPERASDQSVSLFFEGVQGDAEVVVNEVSIGRVRSGYAETELPIDEAVRWGADNSIRILVDHRAQPTERWYPGSGLYRDVHVVLRGATHLARDGIRMHTTELGETSAAVRLETNVVAPHDDVTVEARLLWDRVVVASGAGIGARATLELTVPEPRAWSAETPNLYELEVDVLVDGDVVDNATQRVGLRTVEVDARSGLRVNGEEVLLRGACIHHDNGALGAATHRAAEYRRIRTLKAAGFNAIRSAHNPMSRALLDACDELGMYVLDELADYWVVRKTAHDHSDRFLDAWRKDADALIAKDRNRASVIMYAIGNEIPETATPRGVELAREIADHFRASDPHRPVTLAVNLFLNAMVSFNASPYAMSGERGDTSMAGSTEANIMINHIGRMMHAISRLPRADKASRDAFATVDVAGYNYGVARYPGDVRRHPDRVILGTETLPGDVARAWALVQQHPAVIGDFVWAGWEYLGEAGTAVWVPGKRAGLAKPYPYRIAGPGMFDLIGRPDASVRLAQAAWGRLKTPAIAVRPLDRSGVPYVRSAWRVTDAVESWSWRGSEGRTAEIEVYATDDEVELFLNDRSLGRRPAGKRRGFIARYRAPYAPGTLTAVGYRDGVAISRSTLRSADADIALRATFENPELAADGDDLAFVNLELADVSGEVEMLADDELTVEVSGPAELVGLGTAAPSSTESFLSSSVTTYRGRALAVLRSTGEAGIVEVRVASRRTGSATASIPARFSDTSSTIRSRT